MIIFSERSTKSIFETAKQNILFTEFMTYNLLNKDVILAGGALRHLFDEEDVISDFDMFFTNKISALSTGIMLEALGYKVIYKCPKGFLTTYKKESTAPGTKDLNMKIQLITERYYDSVQELIDTFDITACRFAYDGTNLATYYSAIRDVKKRRVDLHKISYPAATFRRMIKYHDKGYRMSNEGIQKYIDSCFEAGVDGRNVDYRFYID
ncbi:MAG: hypothetical protein P4L79_10240 [Legionella sp.]|uniref:hypothetical protein n=1 Tax=Legionella sp. TaxID=459 RepID=UPI002850B211|nr:hypothetical protein [Legionella sp.]